MSIDKMAELQYGDIIEIGAGLTKVTGYFIKKDDHMIYIASTIPKFPSDPDPCKHVTVPKPTGYYHTNLEIEVLRQYY